MKRPGKITVTVVQLEDMRQPNGFVYRVSALQNDIDPAIGTRLSPTQVRDLIDRGVTVNVKDTGK